MCLRFQFCTHQRVCILYFLKKVKFVVPYCTVGRWGEAKLNFILHLLAARVKQGGKMQQQHG